MGNLKQRSHQDAINWVSKAWDSIKQLTIVNSFLICGISNALDGSENDHVSDDLPVIELDSGTMGKESEEDKAEDSDSDADEPGDPFSDDSDTQLEQWWNNERERVLSRRPGPGTPPHEYKQIAGKVTRTYKVLRRVGKVTYLEDMYNSLRW